MLCCREHSLSNNRNGVKKDSTGKSPDACVIETSDRSMNEFKPNELMQSVVVFLERESVPYRIVGSIASIIYGEPPFTRAHHI
ncbi:hypothetical protein Pan161_57810 [Gimesia algae]|uniref:Uncharacterized protein n=1 Tax=Gimesia algae TaxID=2527971 RepID=A0A517VM53_9PLAN|nr:hypothetical protein Pan161_57810 [Gimesia algae]